MSAVKFADFPNYLHQNADAVQLYLKGTVFTRLRLALGGMDGA
jgi:hypothetical protein